MGEEELGSLSTWLAALRARPAQRTSSRRHRIDGLARVVGGSLLGSQPLRESLISSPFSPLAKQESSYLQHKISIEMKSFQGTQTELT